MRHFLRSDGRYYLLSDATTDLFGDQVYLTFFGSIHNRRGGMKRWPVDSTNVEGIVRTRLQHGYVESKDIIAADVVNLW